MADPDLTSKPHPRPLQPRGAEVDVADAAMQEAPLESYSAFVGIKFRPSERALLLARAIQCGKPLGTYIRETVLGVVPKERPNRITEAAALELNRIGVNLNQLAKVANREGLAPVLKALATLGPQIEAALRRLL